MGAFAREWRVIVAILAVASLGLLFFVYPTSARQKEKERSTIEEARRLIGLHEYSRAERVLREFLEDRPDSPHRPQAEYLLGRARLGGLSQRAEPGGAEFESVGRQFRTAIHRGHESRPCEDGMIETANLARDRGSFKEASDLYRELIEVYNRREVTLDFATCLGLQAVAQPDNSQSLLREADQRISDYLLDATGPERDRALLVRAQIEWRHRRYDAMLKTAAETHEPEHEPHFSLVRGKALSRLGRANEAVDELNFARTHANDPDVGREAAYFEAELRLRNLDAGGVPIARDLIDTQSKFEALCHILLGRYELEVRQEDPYALLVRGLSGIPNVRDVESYDPDLEGLYARVRTHAGAEESPERIESVSEVLEQYMRLYPNRLEYAFDAADLRTRAGAKLTDRARGRRLLLSAAGIYERITKHPLVPRGELLRAHLGAATAYRGAGRPGLAAPHFRTHYEGDPRENSESLYLQGLSLLEAGIYETRYLHEPDALGVFGEYLKNVGPRGAQTPDVVIHRARIQMSLGRHADALDTLQPMLREAQYGIDPTHPKWGEALLLTGEAWYEIAIRGKDPDLRRRALMEARRRLNEYLDRYADGLGEDEKPPAGALDACFTIARAAIEDLAWSDASAALERMVSLSTRIPPAGREAQAVRLRQAYFLLGDLYMNQGRAEDALAAYDLAFRKFSGTDERIGAMLGRARALLRMGREADAKQALTDARLVYESNRESFDASFDGRGAEYWPGKFREIERELP